MFKIFVFDRVVCGMASANVPVENPFLAQIERIRVELRERVARARQVLQEREIALLSELQQLEDTYRGEGVDEQIDQLRKIKEQNMSTLTDDENQELLQQVIAPLNTRMRELEASLETAKDTMRLVELEWDTNLEGILSRTGSIRVRGLPDYKEKGIRGHTAILITEGKPTRGLKKTSYINSILQCLSHTLPIRRLYVSDEYKEHLNNRGDLSNAFSHVMVELWDSTSSHSVHPNDLKKQIESISPKVPKYNQHDAHEFMRFLLNELHEEINRANEEGRKSPADNETLEEACARHLTWEDSRISQLFSGMLRSDVCCTVCNNQSTAYIPFMDLSLPIVRRKQRPFYNAISTEATVLLADCLRMFTTEEMLDEEESPYCNTCIKPTKSSRHVSIAKLPRYLVIQLKRLSYHPKRTKLSTRVEFDYTWELIDSDNTVKIYSLYAVVCHSGGVSGGHYTAYCNYCGVWRCFDDKIVKSVTWEYVAHQEAYILFYKL